MGAQNTERSQGIRFMIVETISSESGVLKEQTLIEELQTELVTRSQIEKSLKELKSEGIIDVHHDSTIRLTYQ